MDFSAALRQIRKNALKGMRLPHWSEEVIIKVQFPDQHSQNTAPYLYVSSRFGRVPWMPTQIELFSEDWKVQ